MRSFVAILGAALVAAASARMPNLPQQWTAEVTDSIAINQGGEPGPQGGLCCPAESPECKIQTAFEVGKMYFDFPNNRTAFLSPSGGGTVTLWNLGKEFEVSASGACEGWCPVQGEMQPFGVGNATDDGPTTYDGQKVEAYFARQAIPILNITMATNTFYIALNSGSGYDTPVAQVTDIEPFGQQLGQEAQTWKEFTAGAPPASVFKVTGIDKCQKAQCGGDGDGSSSSSSSPEVVDRALANAREEDREMLKAAIESFTLPPGYSEPSHLMPRPALN